MTVNTNDEIWLSYQTPKTLLSFYQKTLSEKVGGYALKHFTTDSAILDKGYDNSRRQLCLLLTKITDNRPEKWSEWATWIDKSYLQIFSFLKNRHRTYGVISHWLENVKLMTLKTPLQKIQRSQELPNLVTSYLLMTKIQEDLETVLRGFQNSARSMSMYETTLLRLHNLLLTTFYNPICVMREILRPSIQSQD